MTQYFFVDESGDAGLDGQASSSRYFVLTMVQLPDRASLLPLVNLRRVLHVASTFEFKYHMASTAQKDRFFNHVLAIPFRVRAVVLEKARMSTQWRLLLPSELITELIISLTLRASQLDIANDVLIIDGATQAFCRQLRIRFTERCKQEKRIRPFKRIVGANSRNEDGLQIADMMAGAIRLHAMKISSEHFYCVAPRIVDLWELD